jgi:hypothetical protein
MDEKIVEYKGMCIKVADAVPNNNLIFDYMKRVNEAIARAYGGSPPGAYVLGIDPATPTPTGCPTCRNQSLGTLRMNISGERVSFQTCSSCGWSGEPEPV